MQTMHLVLPVGAHDWEDNPLGEAEFRRRITAIQDIMDRQNWAGMLVYGDIHDNGLLTYVSNFGARLSGALVLIPKTGEPRLLSFDGGRMVPAGALTTWIEDVRAAGNVDEALSEWLGELPGELPARGPLAVAGFDIMAAQVHDKIIAIDEIAEAADATPYLQALARNKSDGELALIKSACDLLSDVESAVSEQQRSGASAANCALMAEKTARNLGAQDARTLFSVDGGQTFIPFQALSDQISNPLNLYVALRLRGYWAEGLMTFPNTGGPDEHALNAMIAAAKPGAGVDELRQGGHPTHPIMGGGLGAGIGCAPEEAPFLDGDDTLSAGDVLSLKAGLKSAILHITDQGNDILWRAGK